MFSRVLALTVGFFEMESGITASIIDRIECRHGTLFFIKRGGVSAFILLAFVTRIYTP